MMKIPSAFVINISGIRSCSKLTAKRALTSGPELPYPRAAVAITVRRREPQTNIPQYVLVQRGTEPGKGQWSLPGGKIELGENVLQAAKRELAEETGLRENSAGDLRFSTSAGGVFGCSDAIYCQTGLKGIDVKFHYVISQTFAEWMNENEEPKLVANDDALDVKWWTQEQIALGLRNGIVSGNVTGVVVRAEELYAVGLL
mmetsp:Transcript_14737/g.22862  ORF Transcript_14737/g.22862 Transcript_14737/m.22862 type:complete len:201 (+) Transcript_14737:328-930(+)